MFEDPCTKNGRVRGGDIEHSTLQSQLSLLDLIKKFANLGPLANQSHTPMLEHPDRRDNRIWTVK
jgi:hypothetical protein